MKKRFKTSQTIRAEWDPGDHLRSSPALGVTDEAADLGMSLEKGLPFHSFLYPFIKYLLNIFYEFAQTCT